MQPAVTPPQWLLLRPLRQQRRIQAPSLGSSPVGDGRAGLSDSGWGVRGLAPGLANWTHFQ